MNAITENTAWKLKSFIVITNKKIHVYLFTYRRAHTLKRALDSLLAQSYTNWICELHNDEPSDEFPEQLVANINDSRILYIRHHKNIGAAASFSLAYAPISEPYISILEDDNWWEPDFLEIALKVLESNPTINLVWANMWKWQESAGNIWTKKQTIWPIVNDEIELISADHPRQVVNHLHSHGAMLLRATPDTTFTIPSTIPVVLLEPIRERAYPLPIALINKPVANFALTLTNCHDQHLEPYLQGLFLLSDSFIKYSTKQDDFYVQAWKIARETSIYLMLAIYLSLIKQKRFSVLAKFPLKDLAFSLIWCGRHPLRSYKMLNAKFAQPELHDFLNRVSKNKLCKIAT